MREEDFQAVDIGASAQLSELRTEQEIDDGSGEQMPDTGKRVAVSRDYAVWCGEQPERCGGRAWARRLLQQLVRWRVVLGEMVQEHRAETMTVDSWGWLASRVKAATGSGVFVICGHNRKRGGVFDYYGIPEVAITGVRTLLRHLAMTDSLDGVVMGVTESASNASIGPDTVFCFDQNGTTITARYGGGAVADGWLVGNIDQSTSQARLHYLQIGTDGLSIVGSQPPRSAVSPTDDGG